MAGKKKIIIIVVVVVSVFVAVKCYIGAHRLVMLWITGSVNADTNDAYEYRENFLRGDTFSLYSTKVTIKEIKYDGTVVLSFKPEVVNSNGENISIITLKQTEGYNFSEKCKAGESASAMIQVVSYKFE